MAQGNKTGKILGIGCAVLILLGSCCGGGGYFGWLQCTKGGPPARAFLHDLKDGNYAAALTRMDGGCQSAWNVGQFQQQVAAYPALTTHTDITLNNYNVNNGDWTISGTLATPSGPTAITVRLRTEGDHHYIYEVTVGSGTIRCPGS